MIVNKITNSSTCPQPMALPHTLAAEEVAARLDIQPDFGLTDAEAKCRNTQYGPNRLPEAQPRSAWLVFFGQFKSIADF